MAELTLTTENDRFVIIGRQFEVTPEALYHAHTKPDLIRKWMLGPSGWTMPLCISNAHPGGKICYEWTNGKGRRLYLTGEFVELQPFRRIVHIERMHMPDSTPDNHVETRFEPNGDGTLMTMRMTLPDEAARTAMLSACMEHGMETSYVRLEELQASLGRTTRLACS